MRPLGRLAGVGWIMGMITLGLLEFPSAGAADKAAGRLDLAEVWPPAAGTLYAISENHHDGNQILTHWHQDGYEGKFNRAGTDEDGVLFTTAVAFEFADVQPGERITCARLRISSAGAEMLRELTLEIRGLIVPEDGFSGKNLPSEMPQTASHVTWRIRRPWSEGDDRLPLYHASPDISPVVNEILSHPDFKTGRLVGFIIQGTGEPTGRTRYVKIDDFARTGESHSPALLEICREVSDTFLAGPMLGRPTDHSVTVGIMSLIDIEAYAEFGGGGELTGRTPPVRAAAGDPLEIEIEGLEPDTGYSYRIFYRRPGDAGFTPGSSGEFHTQRLRGSSFAFTIQADSHIIGKIKRRNPHSLNLYRRTLENVLLDEPDFHISMGDFVHIELYAGRNASSLHDGIERYLVQRHLMGDLTRQAPFFLVIGNHEAEQGWRRTRGIDSLEIWGTLARKVTIPNPYPDDFFSGSTDTTECCGLRENYYAWQWGDALFVVLDPFWYTMRIPHGVGPYISSMDAWDWTLGKEQYDWLHRTLSVSDVRWKFVFAHHMTGGLMRAHGKSHPYGRGGIDAAKYRVSSQPTFEWGGEDESGAYVFDKKRPGWGHGPIHDILVEAGVDIFFHGHDHAFVYEELDGVVYQECPVPSSTAYDRGYVKPDSYTTGKVVNNSGHLKVTVSQDSLRVDYIRAVLAVDEPLEEEGETVRNRTVSYSYSLRP